MAARVARALRSVSINTPLSQFSQFSQLRSQRPSHTISFLKSLSTTTLSTMQPKIATGQDDSKVKSELEGLIDGGWQLDKEEIQLEKTYHLAGYRNVKFLALEIMSRSQLKNHHPVLTITFSSVTVHWTTHSPRGLSEKDTFMAKYCDGAAKAIGTVDPEETKKCGPGQSSQI